MGAPKLFVSLEKGLHKDNPHCFRCGDCCVRIPAEIRQEEIELISSRLNKKWRQIFLDNLTRNPKEANPLDPYMMPLTRAAWIKAPCCFLKYEKNGNSGRAICRIYSFRPLMCRVFHCGKKAEDEPLITTKFKFEMIDEFKTTIEQIEKEMQK